MFTDVVIPKTIHDYIEARAQMISLREQAAKLIDKARTIGDEIGSYVWPYEERLPMADDKFVQELDRRLWAQAFDKTGFMQLMDAKARNEFDNSLRNKPPVFSLENIQTTFLSLAQESDMMFKRGIVNVFLALDNRYRTNAKEPFKVDRRMVVEFVFSIWVRGELRIRHGAEGKINDIDRVLKVLDGKQHTPRGLEMAINEAMQRGNVYEDDYLKLTGFKNGNAHITIKRLDLLDRVNELISEYYHGQALASAA